MESFNKLRQRDINLELAVSDEEKYLTFYFISKSNNMNSFSKSFMIENNVLDKVTQEIIIKTMTLEKILDKYLPESTTIDFMSVDAEGQDYKVLISNNWEKYRSFIIIVETTVNKTEDVSKTEIAKFLKSFDYEIISVIFQE